MILIDPQQSASRAHESITRPPHLSKLSQLHTRFCGLRAKSCRIWNNIHCSKWSKMPFKHPLASQSCLTRAGARDKGYSVWCPNDRAKACRAYMGIWYRRPNQGPKSKAAPATVCGERVPKDATGALLPREGWSVVSTREPGDQPYTGASASD